MFAAPKPLMDHRLRNKIKAPPRDWGLDGALILGDLIWFEFERSPNIHVRIQDAKSRIGCRRFVTNRCGA
jgi:hypothetical protein